MKSQSQPTERGRVISKKALLLSLGLLGALCLSAVAIQQEFRVTRLGEKAALFQIGRESTTNIVVLASRRGLVVIDTGVLPSRAAALRAAIEREFGRKDFAYVINTHSHFDHIDGNQAFADVPIVAQQNAAREMTRWYQTPAAINAFLRNYSQYQAGLQAELNAAADGSPDSVRIQEEMAQNDALMADFRQGRLVLTRPTILFNDRLSLDMGDLNVNLIYFGRAHTDSDILIQIPELRLLMVGDLFSKKWLPTFQGMRSDVPHWFQVLDSLPAGPQAAETVICGHEDPMTGDELRTQAAYLRDIWEGVAAARREGANLAATKTRFPFETKYPGVAAVFAPRQHRERHLANVEAAWRLQSESAAAALESLIAARGLEAAVAEYKKTIAGNERYNVAEDDFIALGYRYAQSGRTGEEVAVFEINAAAFPGSWNAWDSLAEGYLLKGDRDKAETLYQKSIELNPENQNGKNQLSRIRGAKLNSAGETKAPLRFDSGASTGLQGPYLGQTPPGTQPVLFAPGIVSSAAAMEFAVTFSPDGKEMYFTRRKDGGFNTLMVSRLEKDGWTMPQEADFAKGFPGNEPFITPDGSRLYFGSDRTKPGDDRPTYGIWVVERTASGAWGEPRYHGPGMYVSTARNGNLYMTDVASLIARDRPVVVYPWSGDHYGAPQRVGGGVNAPVNADHGYIAPDESYILFDSSNRPGGQGGEGDLHVCFRKPDGSWGEALNLGDAVNTPGTNFCPSISPDGKYIFYSTCRDIYWVSTKILDDLKAKAAGSAGDY